MELSEFGLNFGVDIDIDANTEDQHIPVKSLPDVAMMPETTAQAIFQEVIPGEVPEIRDDLTIVAADTGALEDLGYLLADLRQAGGMNQSFAQEAKRLYHDFDQRNPLGYYTKQTTATRYQVATESLFDRLKEAFKDLIKRLREMIRRFVLWLVGARDYATGLMAKSPEQMEREVNEAADRADQRSDEIQRDMEDLRDLATKVQQEVQRGIDIKDQHGETVHISSFDKLVAHYLYDTEAADEVRQFMEGRNPIFHDIIEDGPWSQATDNLVEMAAQVLSIMKQKLTMLGTVIGSASTADMTAKLINTRTLEVLNQRLEVHYQGRKMNLQDVSAHYNRVYTESSQGEPHHHLSFEQVFGRFAQALSTGPMKRLVETGRALGLQLLQLERTLDSFEVQIGNVLTDGAKGMPDQDMAAPLREALDSIRQDVRDLSMVANRMNAYRTIVETMSARVVGFAHRLSVAIYGDMQNSTGGSDAPEVIQDLAKQAALMRFKHAKAVSAGVFSKVKI